jgi:predicted dehydrogenase
VTSVTIIGVGALGSRHLQAMALADYPVEIYAVDGSEKSLAMAKSFFEEIPSNNNVEVSYLKKIADLPDEIDCAIVATGSAPRLSIIKELLEAKKVKNLILEKILFQSIPEYDEAKIIIEQYDVPTWVNCPRRMMPFFKNLGEHFSAEETLLFKAEGSGWGLACNAIHHIDNFSMYFGETDYKLDTSYLEKVVRESKRQGYIELTGKLVGTFRDQHTIEMVCNHEGAWSLTNSIESENKKISFKFGEKTAIIFDKLTEKTSGINFETVPQSQLTHIAVKDILQNRTCELPSLETSTKLHKPLIEELLAFTNALTGASAVSLAIT